MVEALIVIKLHVIGGKLPLFTQEASFMESIAERMEYRSSISRRNPSNARFLCLLIVGIGHVSEFNEFHSFVNQIRL